MKPRMLIAAWVIGSVCFLSRSALSASQCISGGGTYYGSNTSYTPSGWSACQNIQWGGTNAGATAFSYFAETGPYEDSSSSVMGFSENNVGLYGMTYYGPSAVFGYSTGSFPGVAGNSISGTGVQGTTGNPDFSNGTWGVAGFSGNGTDPSDGASNVGVYGVSTNGDGGHFLSSDSSFAGVVGKNTYVSSSAAANGVYGSSASGAGAGVYGNNSNGGNGVVGVTNSSSTSVAGVWGYNPSSGWAGYFSGNAKVTGTFDVGGTCNASCSSDRRLKRGIVSLPDAIDQVLKLRGVHYEWITPDERRHPGVQTGFVAQEVEQVFPKWVGEDQEGFKTINIPPMEMAALTVESIRSLKMENDALKAEVKSLKSDHESRISNLETGAHPIAASMTSGLGISPGNLGLALATLLGCFFMTRKKDEKSA